MLHMPFSGGKCDDFELKDFLLVWENFTWLNLIRWIMNNVFKECLWVMRECHMIFTGK
jgi:hypothetical protein